MNKLVRVKMFEYYIRYFNLNYDLRVIFIINNTCVSMEVIYCLYKIDAFR